MDAFEGELQIRKIRKRGYSGGIIFSAITTDLNSTRYVVKADYNVARSPALFREAHIWRVKGTLGAQTIKWKDGSSVIEKVITPTSLEFVKASQENLKRLLAESPDFKGISEVKADKLVNFFGNNLVDIALCGDVERLRPILGQATAEKLVIGLQNYEVLAALQLLDKLGVPPHIGDAVLKIWQSDAYSHIKKNPYILTAFEADLNMVDAYAIDRLGMPVDSPERLIAYAKTVLFNAFANGNTCLTYGDWRYQTKRLLGDMNLCQKAVNAATDLGEVIKQQDLVQVRSMHIIESGVASIINHLKNKQFNHSFSDQMSRITNSYEQSVGFQLTEEQRSAVLDCCNHAFTVLTGGAGCGKTTVIEAICFALEELGQTKQILLMALAEKAVQRITEATGHDAMTVAGFLHNLDGNDLDDDAVIIVDEASMIDILSFYKILKRIPINGRIILTGDQEQLPPVGIGLTLHKLVDLNICHSHLSVIKRHSEASGIPVIANRIRNWTDDSDELSFSPYEGKGLGVSFIECDLLNVENDVIDLYQQLGGDGSSNDINILCPVKMGAGGINNINAKIHDKFITGEPFQFDNEEFSYVNYEIQGCLLKVGELVMYTKNDYDKDIRNGSVGKILKQTTDGAVVNFSDNIVTLSNYELNHLTHAYAMTVHKSQGSQFDRVVVVIKKSRNLDRHLIYTALTRAKHQVVFIGNKKTFYDGLRLSNSLNRHTLLGEYL